MPLAVVTLSTSCEPQEIVEIIDRDGSVIVEGFVPADRVRHLNEDLDDVARAWVPGSRFDDEIMQMAHGRHTKRFSSLPLRSPTFLKILSDERVAAVADYYLLPSCGSYSLNTGQLMEIGPGEPAQVMHRDDLNWPGSGPSLIFSVHTITALTDFTEANGATVVAPSSQLWGDPNRYPEPSETARAVMPAGSTLFYTGQLVHGAGANTTTSERRRAIEMSFVLGWLRTEENHCLALPLELVCSFPERVQMLLGYRGYEHRSPAGRLGLVDYADPVHFLRERGLVGPDAQEGCSWPLRALAELDRT